MAAIRPPWLELGDLTPLESSEILNGMARATLIFDSLVFGPLTSGAPIELIAPGSSCPRSELEAGQSVLRLWGFQPRVPAACFGRDPFSANTDVMRLKHLRAALRAPGSQWIWAIRGGYGCARLLPGLGRMTRPLRRKLLLGYSDITALHVFFNQVWGWPTLHAPMVCRVGSGKMPAIERRELRELMSGRRDEFVFTGLRPLNAKAERPAVQAIQSFVVGGNLAVLASLVGTPWALRPNGAIVFLEDIGERGYQIDRLLEQLWQSGFFANVRAVVLGDFVGDEEPDGRRLAKVALRRLAERAKFPVFAGMPVGHGPRQRLLPLLTKARLELGPQGRLIVSTTAVASAAR